MATTALNRMIDQVKRLNLHEQKELRAAIDRLLEASSELPTEEQFEQELVGSGILEGIPSPPQTGSPSQEWRPIESKGKPFSETIVEDRR
jgi:hypothetical protein